MNIAVKGSPERSAELNQVLSSVGLNFTRLESTKNIHSANYDVIFDLNFDDDQSGLDDYNQLNGQTLLFLSSVKVQLDAIIPKHLFSRVAGINALQTFLLRPSIEYCILSEEFNQTVFSQLGWSNANKVDSRVGLVSPRVIMMIINEAYYTLQEGTADRNDIDLGMKLGTAYPKGPFEWAEQIGIKDVFEVLDALYSDTRDERYKICSRLKTEYIQNKQK
ncbi:MAG TPA: 3-hydroxyacyl-CoA dehydrogenase family protein [Bacteroidia bacterium]